MGTKKWLVLVTRITLRRFNVGVRFSPDKKNEEIDKMWYNLILF